jgi:hypothetical protein
MFEFGQIEIKNIFTYIGLLAVLVMILLALGKVWNKFFGSHGWIWVHPVRKEAEQNREIYNELMELRFKSKADRSYVLRFHNGIEFLPSHPAWKISCTHEIVQHGVTYESSKMQGILVSLIQGIVGPVLTGISASNGVTVIECPDCPYKNKCLKENKRVIVIQVDKMEGDFCKFHLESQNVKTVIMCGIASGGNVYGIVGMDFCGVEATDIQVKESAMAICRATEKIQFHLQYKKAMVD